LADAQRIKSAKSGPHRYGCLMYELREPLRSRILMWAHKKISDQDLYHGDDPTESGRETVPHVTVRYGFNKASPDDIRAALADSEPFPIRLGTISRFTSNPKYDVLKIDVESDALRKMYARLGRRLSTVTPRNRYRPHITLAYVNKGAAGDLVGKDVFDGEWDTAGELVYSDSDASRHPIPLMSKSAAFHVGQWLAEVSLAGLM